MSGSFTRKFQRVVCDVPVVKNFRPSKTISPLNALTLDEVETGPVLSLKKRDLLERFVSHNGGKRVIQRILIANNGMAATKSILSMKNWAYMNLGDESALEFVVMATKDDLNANAEFIRLADAFVEVPSGSNKVRCSYTFLYLID